MESFILELVQEALTAREIPHVFQDGDRPGTAVLEGLGVVKRSTLLRETVRQKQCIGKGKPPDDGLLVRIIGVEKWIESDQQKGIEQSADLSSKRLSSSQRMSSSETPLSKATKPVAKQITHTSVLCVPNEQRTKQSGQPSISRTNGPNG